MYGVVKSVIKEETINENIDCCKVEIDFDELYMFGKYNEIVEYLEKEVEYECRHDMYHGREVLVVCSLANMYTIQTIDKPVDSIKLIPEDSKYRSMCNFSVDTMKSNDFTTGAVVFMSGYEVAESAKAKWVDMTCVDKVGKQFVVKYFATFLPQGYDLDGFMTGLIGHYIKIDVKSSKYGYSTDSITMLNEDVVLPPEVDIAKAIILDAVKEDTELVQYMNKYEYIKNLESAIYGEVGYHLVYVAAEIMMIKAVSNLAYDYNTKLLIRAAITSRGYLLPASMKFSPAILNNNKVLRTDLKNDTELVLILDALALETPSSTKMAYIDIANFTKKILDTRRGLIDLSKTTLLPDEVRNMLGGLV